jgi:hypothetical protein
VGWALSALRPRRPGPQPMTAGQLGAARRLAASARADSHLAVERYAGEVMAVSDMPENEGGNR